MNNSITHIVCINWVVYSETSSDKITHLGKMTLQVLTADQDTHKTNTFKHCKSWKGLFAMIVAFPDHPSSPLFSTSSHWLASILDDKIGNNIGTGGGGFRVWE